MDDEYQTIEGLPNPTDDIDTYDTVYAPVVVRKTDTDSFKDVKTNLKTWLDSVKPKYIDIENTKPENSEVMSVIDERGYITIGEYDFVERKWFYYKLGDKSNAMQIAEGDIKGFAERPNTPFYPIRYAHDNESDTNYWGIDDGLGAHATRYNVARFTAAVGNYTEGEAYVTFGDINPDGDVNYNEFLIGMSANVNGQPHLGVTLVYDDDHYTLKAIEQSTSKEKTLATAIKWFEEVDKNGEITFYARWKFNVPTSGAPTTDVELGYIGSDGAKQTVTITVDGAYIGELQIGNGNSGVRDSYLKRMKVRLKA